MRIIKNKYKSVSASAKRPIKAAHDEYVWIKSKTVPDSDGFLTEYTLYSTTDGDYYFCMFGDSDIYGPDPDYADFETWSLDEAMEWFDNYEGFTDDDIYGAEEVVDNEENEDIGMLKHNQEFTSKNTAINWKRGLLPYLLTHVPYGSNDVVLDYGGGTKESEALAMSYFADTYPDIEYVYYDKYWQNGSEQNQALRRVKQAGGADVALLSNVLNVIKEPEVRNDVLNHVKSLLKPGGKLYIYGYEGKKDDQERGGRATANDQYQTFMKTKDYLSEIHEVFPNANYKGGMIVAINDNSAVAASFNPSDIIYL
jgi:hypothetical protein